MTDLSTKVILATRKSPLALKQTDLASSVLTEKLAVEAETLPLSTTGDQRLEWSLEQEGGKGLFTKELEVALLEGRRGRAQCQGPANRDARRTRSGGIPPARGPS